MSMEKCQHQFATEKSRRDETLLTVDFNLRVWNDVRPLPSPAGTTLCIVPSLRDLEEGCSSTAVGYATLHLRLIKCCPCGTFSR